MSSSTVARLGETAHDIGLEAAWVQWAALTPLAASRTKILARSMIDPEALVLFSLLGKDRERRLTDVLAAWARGASFLLSVHRINALAAGYPDIVYQRIPDFAAIAAKRGDKRWKSLAGKHVADQQATPAREKALGPLRLTHPPALMLRLRAAFGVGAKADLLGFLLGNYGASADLKTIAIGTGYTTRALRKATEEMELAGMIAKLDAFPAAFSAPYSAWAHVLDPYYKPEPSVPPSSIPRWYYWSAVFAFLAGVVAWSEQARSQHWSSYVASSRLRDVVDAHQQSLRRAQLPIAQAHTVPGHEYLELFHEVLRRTRESVREHL